MLTALLTGIAFLLGAFFERIVVAIMILLLARWTMRRLRALRARVLRQTAPLRAAASHKIHRWMRTVAMVFGPTVHV